MLAIIGLVTGLLFALPLLRGDSIIKLIPPVESRSYILTAPLGRSVRMPPKLSTAMSIFSPEYFSAKSRKASTA